MINAQTSIALRVSDLETEDCLTPTFTLALDIAIHFVCLICALKSTIIVDGDYILCFFILRQYFYVRDTLGMIMMMMMSSRRFLLEFLERYFKPDTHNISNRII